MNIAKRQKLEEAESEKITILTNKTDECLPIKSLEDLIKWKPSIKNHVTAPLQRRIPVENCPKTLICHDMKGGYLDDRFINGSNSENNYYFLHWTLIDIFVYFSHHLVTIPPCSWISAAHKNGVQILGTFITEWEDGIKICEKMLKDENIVEEVTAQLVNIAHCYKFDGWLINIENKLQVSQVPLLQKFVKDLTYKIHSCNSGSQVIWYDSVLKTGDLKWQNALNENNKMFFDCCDGIFLNYNWTEETLQQSVEVAGERKTDVFVGVDVFGRGCLGGGGFCTNIAVEEARKFNLSVAIFAPGWTHECLNVHDFKDNQYKFWDALQKLCSLRVTKQLPYSTSFCPGFGYKLFKNGKILSEEPWFNIGLQEPQPIYNSNYCSQKANLSIYNEDAFNGGGCICLEINPGSDPNTTVFTITNFKILKTYFKLLESVIVSYTFKPLNWSASVNLRLSMRSSSEQTYYLHLVNSKPENRNSESIYLFPAINSEVNLKENPSIIENWLKRVFLIKSSDFKNHTIEDINIVVKTLSNEKSSVLIGEIQILPLKSRIEFIYRDLKCQPDKDNINVKCTLQWSYHPSILYSDLFLLDEDEKRHICRTSQFYYDMELCTGLNIGVNVLLSVHTNTKEYFPDSTITIPVKL